MRLGWALCCSFANCALRNFAAPEETKGINTRDSVNKQMCSILLEKLFCIFVKSVWVGGWTLQSGSKAHREVGSGQWANKWNRSLAKCSDENQMRTWSMWLLPILRVQSGDLGLGPLARPLISSSHRLPHPVCQFTYSSNLCHSSPTLSKGGNLSVK